MMPRLREWLLRLWATVANRRGDVEEELRFHLEMAEEAALRRGASVREARVQARGFVQASDAVRDQTGIAWLADFFRDSRHALRNLAKSRNSPPPQSCRSPSASARTLRSSASSTPLFCGP